MVIRAGVEVESWNGRKWRTWPKATDVCTAHLGPSGVCILFEISCGNASSCVAGGTVTADAEGDLAGVSADWDGHGWGWDFSPILFGGTPPQSAWLTCIRQGFCLAAGLHGAATWTAARGWSDVSAGLGLIGPAGCGSPASCMIVGVLATRAYAWNGSSWQATPAVPLPGVSRLVSAV